MKKIENLVSIIIPTRNSSQFLQDCLLSIQEQSYKSIEVLIVDGKSSDNTREIAKKYHATIMEYLPKVPKGTFDAPHKRNYGVKKSKGTFVYYLDADMRLEKGVIKEAVLLCQKSYAAVIVPEDSFGIGIWAKAKQLERRCYWGDDSIEAPRFFRKDVWEEVGGIDETVGGGGDDWDLYQKVLEKGYKVGRTKSMVLHNEGKLELKKLFRKRFMYGRETVRYVSKRPKAGFASYFPFRKAYFTHWKLFVKQPFVTVAFFIMRTAEYSAGFGGIVYSVINKKR